MWVPVVAKYHQPAKFPSPFSNRNGRTGGTSSNRTPRHDISGPRCQAPSAARKSSVNPVSAAPAAATAALANRPPVIAPIRNGPTLLTKSADGPH